ncbi:MAG: stage II sporulation protein P [Clostridium sp.]|nr:stage II sporulation protein P [Clostridium sp.]
MINRKMNSEKNSLLLILLIDIMLFSIIAFFSFFDVQQEISLRLTDESKNTFYFKLISYQMPIVKLVNFKGSNLVKDTPSLKSCILNYLGINLNEPYAILKKELFYLNQNSGYNLDHTSAIGNFTLNNNDVIKQPINLNNVSNQNNNIDGIYDSRLKEPSLNSKPEILIYHSHTTESYGSNGKDTLDPNKNVTAVGDKLASILKEYYNISVIHDTTVHNAAAYNNSYERSGQTLDNYLKKYGNFKMIIDLDRTTDSNKSNVTKLINGKNVAKFTFNMAKNNPNLNENMKIVSLLLNYSNCNFKGLTIANGVNYCNNAANCFNQNKSNNAFLLEIGSEQNTMDESLASTPYIAKIIAEYLNSERFIATVAPYAQDTYKKDKIYPSVTLAQAMQESEEGISTLSTKANNLFGIKAFDWPYQTVIMPTSEHYNGKDITIMSKFRAYDSWKESVDDHGNFLVDNSVYKNHGVFSSTSYEAQAKALQSAGYATDPNYASELIDLVKEYNLNKYDNIK